MVGVAVGFLMLMNSPKEQGIYEMSSEAKEKSNDIANRNLYYTQKKIEFEQQLREKENAFSAPAVGDVILPFKNQASPLDFSSDINDQRLIEHLRGTAELDWNSPRNQIMAELSDQDRVEEYVEAYKENYAREFIANALRNGYVVTLDGNFRVLSVRPVPRQPSAAQSGFSRGSN